MMNRIIFDTKSQEHAHIFANRIITQYFRRRGCMGAATFFSLAWTKRARQLSEAMSRPNQWKLRYEIQECFVIFHELFHNLYEHRERIRERGARYASIYSTQELPEARGELGSVGIQTEEFNDEEKNGLVCELTCDAMAIVECVRCFLFRPDLSPLDLAKTILWGLQHIGWIEELENYLSRYIELSRPPESREWSASTLALGHRVTLAGNCLSEVIVDLIGGGYRNAEPMARDAMIHEFALALSEAGKFHANFFAFDFERLADRLQLVHDLGLDVQESFEWEKVSREIDLNTGWHLDDPEKFPTIQKLDIVKR